MQNNQNSPFDGKVLIAIGIFFVFYFGWQQYLAKKYPQPVGGSVSQGTTKPSDLAASSAAQNAPAASSPKSAQAEGQSDGQSIKTNNIPEKFLTYEDDLVSFKISNRGMGLSGFTVKKYTGTNKLPIQIGVSVQEHLFEVMIGGQPQEVFFEISESNKGQYKGTATVAGSRIERELKYDSAKYSFESSIKIVEPSAELLRGIHIVLPEAIQKSQSTSILFPSYEYQDFFIEHGQTKDVVNFNHAKENIDKEFKDVKILAMGSQYFTAAIQDKSDISPEVRSQAIIKESKAISTLSYRPAQNLSQIDLKQIFYVGPKSIDILKSIDPSLAQVIDFGFLGFIARPMLYTMKWIYSWAGNWGIAIIFLTLIVRVLVLPFNVMSFKSMKAMQVIQPHMTAVREKHKDDPVRMNQEVMALMKEHKANPLGGCLPMLLQIPIFFALYRVIGSSVELYQSPFGFWIKDLSAHDSFFVLPVLMGVTMYIQQKMTPTAMDPTQAKILAFMPLIFTAFMLTLPSGLTLYMFVSALFGITQQYFLLKPKAT